MEATEDSTIAAAANGHFDASAGEGAEEATIAAAANGHFDAATATGGEDAEEATIAACAKGHCETFLPSDSSLWADSTCSGLGAIMEL